MPSTSSSTCDSPGAFDRRTFDRRTSRTSLGVDIVRHEESPARLPGEGTPDAAHRLLAHEPGEYLFVGLRGVGTGGRAAVRPPKPADSAPAAGPTGLSTAAPIAPGGPAEPLGLWLEPGDVCFYDVRRAPALGFREPFRTTVFLVPAELLDLSEPEVRRIVRTPVARASRLGALLSPVLSDLARAAAEARPPVGEMLAWNAVNLLSTLAAEQSGTGSPGSSGPSGEWGTPGAQPPVLARILEYVELHLTEPDLCPEGIARAHHISVRYLHRLFKDEGATVSRWILRRRLEECRRDLIRHGRESRTIAAVAGRWGFLSATHFSRVFRAAYGMSPREWRDAAGRAAPPVPR
ncbi:helix-turn-helix domain-containing protein [Streptomyces scabiei]|uniref:helix-turn-helix domain-containing protein n=1 Tax=Streptomyces scabiei TaxID=1930 RepID=UPI0029B3FC3E|nr:helix-turn-helix domain-containing protein [Streptomyces scabiei]MDX3117764.1 helix-turn-helix domain-containing protein [Streptomyces scabiei]